eukprot:scaffold307796_cov14-Tisochrysis_lutea.AAC.1
MGCTKRKRESGPPWELCTRHNTELACNHTRSPGTTSTCGVLVWVQLLPIKLPDREGISMRCCV